MSDPFEPPGHPGPMYDGLSYPGFGGIPPRAGQMREGLSAFGRLAKGCGLGQKVALVYNALGVGYQGEDSPDILAVSGDDMDACQMVVHLGVPGIVSADLADLAGTNLQNAGPDLSNYEIPDVDFPGTLAPAAWPPIKARVEWGTGGHKHTAFVDLMNGSQFSVSASYLRVKPFIDQSQTEGFGGTSAIYQCPATVGPGWTPSSARCSRFVGVVAQDAESGVFDVPPYASKVTAYLCDTSAVPNVTSAYVRFWQSPSGVVGGLNVGNVFVGGNQPGPFVIPAGAQYFSVYNQSGIAGLVVVVFDLAIG